MNLFTDMRLDKGHKQCGHICATIHLNEILINSIGMKVSYFLLFEQAHMPWLKTSMWET